MLRWFSKTGQSLARSHHSRQPTYRSATLTHSWQSAGQRPFSSFWEQVQAEMEKDESGKEALQKLKKAKQKTEAATEKVTESAEKMVNSSEAQDAARKASEKASSAASSFSSATAKSTQSAKSFASRVAKHNVVRDSRKKIGQFGQTVAEKLSKSRQTLQSKVGEATKQTGVNEHLGKVSQKFEGVSKVVESAKKTFREDILLQKPERKVYYTYQAPSDSDEEVIQTGVTVQEDDKSAWAKHKDNISSKVKGTEAYTKFTKARSAAKKSSVGQKVSEVKTKVQDKMEDAREEWDTTQNPLVWKIRDASDQMFSETEAGIAQTKIRDQFPDFNLLEFIEFSHEVLFPKLVTAFLSSDEKYIRQVCEGNAVRGLAATIRERESKKEIWDTRILDMSDVDFQSAGIDQKNRPVITVSVMCQHVHCVRSTKDDKIVDGGETDLRSTFYMLTVRPDPACQHDLGWKIVEMQLQHVSSLGI